MKLEISKVHDAYRDQCECPLCTLMDAAEKTYLRSFQHSRVMEPNVRLQTNIQGFCADHYGRLFQGENKLGLSLVVQTHLRELAPRIGSAMEDMVKAAEGRKAKEKIRAAAAPIAALGHSCFICSLLGADMARYTFTVLYLWNKDPDFLSAFRASRGFCIPHFLAMLEEASGSLRIDRLARWLADVVPLMTDKLARLDQELSAFSQLHQAGNASLGSDEERTALGRTLQTLAGGIFST